MKRVLWTMDNRVSSNRRGVAIPLIRGWGREAQ
jgi:hypothetical protein